MASVEEAQHGYFQLIFAIIWIRYSYLNLNQKHQHQRITIQAITIKLK